MVNQILVINDLDVFEAGPVIEGDETDGTRIAIGPDPTLQEDVFKRGEILSRSEASIELRYSDGFLLHGKGILHQGAEMGRNSKGKG